MHIFIYTLNGVLVRNGLDINNYLLSIFNDFIIDIII